DKQVSFESREGKSYMRRTKDGRIPLPHHQIIAVSETIRASIYVPLTSALNPIAPSTGQNQPALSPFSPFSSSSRSLKFLGTFAMSSLKLQGNLTQGVSFTNLPVSLVGFYVDCSRDRLAGMM